MGARRTKGEGSIYQRADGPWVGRGDLGWEESVRHDLRYVENWSIVNDLQIMWRTAKVMFAPTGAY